VVTDVGDSALIVGEAGRVVPPKNPEALAEACEKLIGLGREGCMQLGAVARARIQKQFSISSIVSQYEDFYQNFSGADRT
jgi:glycosyltransferase involved in cell wall biosynthesis